MAREKTADWAGERIRERFRYQIPVNTMAIIQNYIIQVEEAAEKRGEEKSKNKDHAIQTII